MIYLRSTFYTAKVLRSSPWTRGSFASRKPICSPSHSFPFFLVYPDVTFDHAIWQVFLEKKYKTCLTYRCSWSILIYICFYVNLILLGVCAFFFWSMSLDRSFYICYIFILHFIFKYWFLLFSNQFNILNLMFTWSVFYI